MSLGSRKSKWFIAGAAALLGLVGNACAHAAPLYKTDKPLGKGLNYLLAHQNPNGSWVPQVGPAVTALVVKGLIQAGYSPNFKPIVRAMHFIESTRGPDGGFSEEVLPNYNTCIVLSTLAVMPGNKYKHQIKAAQKFLISMQRVAPMKEPNGKLITKNSSWYGGVGYGTGRPDLSNTSFFIQALHDSGVPASNPAMKRALVFVERCQENSETNPEPFAKGLHNGGFIYTAANGGESQFGDTDHLSGRATLTPYGTMTYAGLKSMIYAGLTKRSPQVRAALGWIRSHWTLNYNPGTGGSRMGLFYYYLMFARTFRALRVSTITDINGVKHNWRHEIRAKLISLQNKNGSWYNRWSPRWLERVHPLVTAYCCLILEDTDKR